jgi:ABC-type transport system substrate-binding protein
LLKIVIFIFQMMKMKSVKNTLLLALMSLVFVACSKGGDSPAPPTPNPPVVTEPSLTASNAVIVDIDPGTSNIYAVLGTAQRIEVRMLSVPTSGVSIVTKLIRLADNTEVFKNEIAQTTTLSNAVNITGLVPGVLYNTEVVVTSKTAGMSSNFRKIEFKMAAK